MADLWFLLKSSIPEMFEESAQNSEDLFKLYIIDLCVFILTELFWEFSLTYFSIVKLQLHDSI